MDLFHKVADPIGTGIHAVTAPIGYAKQGVDALTRWGAKKFYGLNLPETATAEGVLMDSLLPSDAARGGLGIFPDVGSGAAYVAGAVGMPGIEKFIQGLPGIDETLFGTQAKVAQTAKPWLSREGFVPQLQQALRAGTSATGEFGASIALDPAMYVLPAALAGMRGRGVAQKILSPAGFPGVRQYAPEIAEALQAAVKTPGISGARTVAGRVVRGAAKALRTDPERLMRLGDAGLKQYVGIAPAITGAQNFLHAGFGTTMTLGAVGGIEEMVGEMAKSGNLSPEAIEAGVHALGSGAMATMIGGGALKKRAAAKAAIELNKKILPADKYGPAGQAKPVPLDLIPDAFQPQAEAYASSLAKRILKEGKDTAQIRLSSLPEEYKDFAPQIWEQANLEAVTTKQGRQFLDRIQENHGVGEKGISEEAGPEGNLRLIQRNDKGEIVGAAELRRNETTGEQELATIAGGRAMGMKESISPLYRRLEELDVKRKDHTTILGTMARRHGAEALFPREVLEGREKPKTRKEAKEATEDFVRAGLQDMLALPRYATVSEFKGDARRLASLEKEIDDYYKSGDNRNAENLEGEIERLRGRLEEASAESADLRETQAEESGLGAKGTLVSEAPGAQEQLARQWVELQNLKRGKSGPYANESAVLDGIRGVLDQAVLDVGGDRKRLEGLSPDHLLLAAKDAYDATVEIRGKLRGAPGGQLERAKDWVQQELQGKKPDFTIRPKKVGEGLAHQIIVDKKRVGHISGFEDGPVKSDRFHIYKTELSDAAQRGTGLYRRVVQNVADKYEQGAYVFEWEASRALKASLEKMSTYEKVGDRIWIRPTKAAKDFVGRQLQGKAAPKYAVDESLITATTPEGRAKQRAALEQLDARAAKEAAEQISPAAPFFSQLRKVVDAPKTQAKQTGEQWLKFLSDPKRGTKKNELKWTGLDEFLKGKKGERVTREEIQKFLDENQVEVSEVVRGGGELSFEEGIKELTPKEQARYWELDAIADGRGDVELTPALDAEHLALIAKIEGQDRLPAQHATYQLPGGENYKELELIIQPQSGGKLTAKQVEGRRKVFDRYRAQITDINEAIAAGERGWDWSSPGFGETRWFRTEEQARTYMREEANSRGTVTEAGLESPEIERVRLEAEMEQVADAVAKVPVADRYPVSHAFPEAGVMSWLRFNDRVGPNGEKILFLEEFQNADWVAKGAKQGFRQPREGELPSLDEVNRALPFPEISDRERAALAADVLDVMRSDPENFRDRLRLDGDWKPEELRIFERDLALERRNVTGLPAAPFVEDTGDVLNLSMKRILKYAADNGYDKVAWTTGEQQIQRWESALRNSVDTIEWEKTPKGVQLRGTKGGNEVINTRVKENELSDTVGKLMADRIRADPEQKGTIADEWVVTSPDGKELGRHKTQLQANAAAIQAAKEADPKLVAARAAWGEGAEKIPTRVVTSSEMLRVEMEVNELASQRRPGETLTEREKELREQVRRNRATKGEDTELYDESTPEYAEWMELSDKLHKENSRVHETALERFKVERSTETGISIDKNWPRQLYDKRIPGALEKVGKKFGAKLGEVEHDVTGQADAFKTTEHPSLKTGKWAGWGKDEKPVAFETEAEARAFAEREGGDFGEQLAFKTQSIDITPQMRETVRKEGLPLFAAEVEAAKTAEPLPMKDFLLKVYPEDSIIRNPEADRWEVELPDGRKVQWNLGKDAIEIDLSAFEEAYGRKPEPGEAAKGVTYRMSNSAIVDIVEGADARIPLHEHWHVLKHMGVLSKRQLKGLEKRFKGNEEAEADAFAEWMKRRTPNTVFEKIWDRIVSLYQQVSGAPEAVFRAAEKGEPLERGVAAPRARAQAFAARKTTAEQDFEDAVHAALQGKPGGPRIGQDPRSEYVTPNDQRIHLQWYLRASGQDKPAKGAKYRKEPQQQETVVLEREGKPFFIGKITPEQWFEKVVAWVGEPGTREWGEARNWYRDLLGEFRKRYGEDEGVRMLTLWGLTQQRAGPSAGLGNLLRAEDVVAGFRPETAPKAGLAHDRLIAALRGDKTTLGQKLSDFVDSIHNAVTRQWVGRDRRGGRPAPIDVHAARDVGYVDEVTVNRVRKLFGDEVADRLKQDLRAAPDNGQYFFGHEFYNRIADVLNEKGVDGGNWQPSEVQALGWVAQQRMFGDIPEGPREIFPASTNVVTGEVSPSINSKRAKVWARIPAGRHAAVTEAVLKDVLPSIAKLSGVRVISKTVRPGFWEQVETPSGVIEILSTPEGALRFAKVAGRVFEQDEVWVHRIAQSQARTNAASVDISSPKGYNLGKAEDASRFWGDAFGRVKGLGGSVVPDGDGVPMLRVIVDHVPETYRGKGGVEKTRLVPNEARVEEVKRALDKWSRENNDADFDYSRPDLEVQKSVNDWEVNNAGQAHQAELRGVAKGELARLSQRVSESLERHVRTAEGDGPVYATEVGGPAPRRRVERPQAPRGPPRGEPAYATERAPEPPEPEKARRTPPGRRPRVETRVLSLKSALSQQKKLGIPQEKLVLDRDLARNWDAIEPEVQKELRNWDDDRVLRFIDDGGRLSDTQVMAMDAVVRGRREAKEFARGEWMTAKAKGEDSPEATAAWRVYAEALADYVPLERANINDGTGTARALAARAALRAAAQTPDRQFLKKALSELDGLTVKDAEQLVRMFETGDPRLADALRAHSAGFWKQWQTLLRAMLITPSSEIPNILGNTIVQGVEVVDSAIAANLDWVASKLHGTKRERYAGELGAELSGWWEAAPAAVGEFLKERFHGIYKRAWTGESPPIDLEKRLEYQVSPFKKAPGRLIATSLDALGAGDQLFRSIIARGEAKKWSYRLARSKAKRGTSGLEVARAADEIFFDMLERPQKYPDVLRKIRSSVSRRLFQGKPWKMAENLKNWERDWPWLAAVIPFVRTPANIARYAIHHSPMGFFSPDAIRAARVLLSGKEVTYKKGGKTFKMGQGEAADVFSRRMTGSAIFGMALLGANAGALTGSGPADYKERRAKMETGWRPYSFVINLGGEKYYMPYARFDPVSQVMGIAADVAEMGDSRDANDMASKAIGSIAENFTDRTYLKGVIDFTEALNNPIRYAGQYAVNIATMHIPRQIARVANAIDPVLRDVRPLDKSMAGLPKRLRNSVIRSIPWASKTLPARYGPTGEPIVRPGGTGIGGKLMRTFSPIQISPARPGRELEALMAEIGYVPGEQKPYVTIQGEQVMLEQRDLEFLHKGDRAAAGELRRLMMLSAFKRLPGTVEEGGGQSKEGVIRDTYRRHRDRARKMMFRNSSFRRRAREQLREARRSA